MTRRQIRKDDRWIHKKSQRGAIVTSFVYPHFVEYKYERPTRWKIPGDWTTLPFTRRTRASYRSFMLNFERSKVAA